MATLRDEIDIIIDNFVHEQFEDYAKMTICSVGEYKQMLDEIMDKIDKDNNKKDLCLDCKYGEYKKKKPPFSTGAAQCLRCSENYYLGFIKKEEE